MAAVAPGQGTPLLRSLPGFFAGIADLRFEQYLSMRLLPFFYVLLMLGAVLVSVIVTLTAFWLSPLIGVLVLACAPFGLLLAFAVIRATLEFLVMAYRIMETVQRMERIPQQVDNLNTRVDGICDEVESLAVRVRQMHGQVDDITETISFLRGLSRLSALPGKLLSRPAART